jgi:signal peptidase I
MTSYRIQALIFGLLIAVVSFATTAYAGPHDVGSPIALTITDQGSVSIDGVQVDEFVGTSFYAHVYFGDALLKLTVRTSPATIFTNHFDKTVTFDQISVGDYVSIVGSFVAGTGSFDVQATSLKDWSNQITATQWSGTVVGQATSTPGFILNTKSGSVQIAVNAATKIVKGSLLVSLSDVHDGDTIVFAQGQYNKANNTLAATSVKIYQDMSVFLPKNYQGTLKTLDTSTSPATIVVTVNGKDYAIAPKSDFTVLSNAKKPANLARFLVGDTVRVYGAIRETSQGTIDAEVFRDIDL